MMEKGWNGRIMMGKKTGRMDCWEIKRIGRWNN